MEQLGVSRTPIREALRRLEQEHLIEDTGKGSRVVGISEEDVRDIMDIREKIEGLAAYYAAVNLTPEGREELKHIRKTRRYRKVSLQDKARAACTLKEHHEIYDAIAAGNAQLAQQLCAKHITNAKNHIFGG